MIFSTTSFNMSASSFLKYWAYSDKNYTEENDLEENYQKSSKTKYLVDKKY